MSRFTSDCLLAPHAGRAASLTSPVDPEQSPRNPKRKSKMKYGLRMNERFMHAVVEYTCITALPRRSRSGTPQTSTAEVTPPLLEHEGLQPITNVAACGTSVLFGGGPACKLSIPSQGWQCNGCIRAFQETCIFMFTCVSARPKLQAELDITAAAPRPASRLRSLENDRA